MRARLQKPRPVPNPDTSVPIHQDIENDSLYLYAASDASPRSKLAPASHGAMNSMNAQDGYNHLKYSNSPTNLSPLLSGRRGILATIRTVPSFDAPSETSSSNPPSARNSGFSSSVHSNVSGASYVSQLPQSQNEATIRSQQLSPDPPPTIKKAQSIDPQMPSSDTTLRGKDFAASTPFASHGPAATLAEENSSFVREGSPQWDGTVGKAGLGKTGRVINKLVSDNESLKRDLKIERLRAEEAKQAARLVEDKMERMKADYENRLREANMDKISLSRKERQVEKLQSAVNIEKKRTAEAQGREQTWREEMDKSRQETKVQIEEANTRVALMDGRYKTIASHWRDQGEEVKRATTSMSARIKMLNKEREQDDEKISVLRDLCDQQESNIRDIRSQKEEIAEHFEAYKREQEATLRDIKSAARQREEEHVKAMLEMKETLDRMRWVINVKENVRGAK